MRIYLYDDYRQSPQKILDDLCDFLDIARFSPDLSARPGMVGIPKYQWLQRALARPSRLRSAVRLVVPDSWRRRLGAAVVRWNRKEARLDPDLRQRLTDTIRPQILDLQDLLDRDLSHWLEEGAAST